MPFEMCVLRTRSKFSHAKKGVVMKASVIANVSIGAKALWKKRIIAIPKNACATIHAFSVQDFTGFGFFFSK